MTTDGPAIGGPQRACPHCGAQVTATQRFCGDCGKPIAAADAALGVLATPEFQAAVEALIGKRLKDGKVLEVETTEAIVNRLSNWAKLFGFFVGIPIALFLAWLAVLGFQSFEGMKSQVQLAQKSAVAGIEKVKGDALIQVETSASQAKGDVNRQLATAGRTAQSVADEAERRAKAFKLESEQVDAQYRDVKTKLAEAGRAADEAKSSSAKLIEEVRQNSAQIRLVNSKLDDVANRLSVEQAYRVRAIVSIFEYGSPVPDYTAVVSLPGDPGGITYVAANASLLSGSLGDLLKAYVSAPGARFSSEVEKYLGRAAAKDASLNTDEGFKLLLQKAGGDPVMQRIQEESFQDRYLVPAIRLAGSLGIRTPLGIATIYDSQVHGSFVRIRDMTNNQLGGSPANGIDERKWVRSFLQNRIQFLSTHAIEVLRATAARPKALLKLADEGNWDLKPPLRIGDVQVNR